MRSRALTLVALCLAAFTISLDVTIVNVALPTLVRRLGATTTGLQWVVDAYSLAFAAFVLAAGGLSDRLGRKGTLLAGLGVFAAASLAGSFSATVGELIAFRAVMGLGAAMMFPATLSLLVNVFTERGERARAIGLWGAMTGVGIAAGPIVGGWLLERFWWGSIFSFLAVIAGIITALVAVSVPTSRDPMAPRLDGWGLAISIGGMAALILGVIEAPQWSWTSPAALAAMTGGAALLGVFAVAESRREHPLLDVRLFRNPRFTAASAAVAVSFFALQGFIFLITQYFQFVQDFTPLGTGVRLLPVASAVAVASVAGTKLAVRVGNNVIVAAGLLLFAAGLLWTSTASASTTYAVIVGQMLLLGAGMGLTSAPATEAIMGAVSEAKAGVGSAVNDATRLFGGTLGVAVVGSVAASLYASRLSAGLPSHLPAEVVSAAKGSVGGATFAAQALHQLGHTHAAHQLATTATSAFLHSLAGGSQVTAGVAVAGAVVAATLLPARPGKRMTAGAADTAPGRWPLPTRPARERPAGPNPVNAGIASPSQATGTGGSGHDH